MAPRPDRRGETHQGDLVAGTIALGDAVRGVLRGEIGKDVALDALSVDQDPPGVEIGEAEPRTVIGKAGDHFDRQVLARHTSMWIMGPSPALVLSHVCFLVDMTGG